MRRLVALFLLALVGLLSSQTTSIDSLKKRVAEIGGLGFTRHVPVRYINRTDLKNYLEGLFATDYPAELSAREEDFLRLMGFTTGRLDLRALRRQIVLENAGGLYNEKTKELMALEEYRSLDMVNTMALVHELRHAAQDQFANLGRLLGKDSDFDDRRLAALSTIEGDATLTMIRYMGLDPATVASFFTPETVLSFSNLGGQTLLQAPDIVRGQLLAPYLDGLRFAVAIFARGGCAALNRVLKDPPRSSSQILHPQLYLERVEPMPIPIRYHPVEWERFHEGVVGEYYLNVLLRSSDQPDDPARGWKGDRFEIWRRGDERTLLFKSAWLSAIDSDRVFSGLKRFLELRYALDWKPGIANGLGYLLAETDKGCFFLHQARDSSTIFFLRTDNRKLMQEFIVGGVYD